MQGHQNTKEARKRLQAYKQKLGKDLSHVLSSIHDHCSITVKLADKKLLGGTFFVERSGQWRA